MVDTILSVAQASKALHIGKDKMYKLIATGQIKAINLYGLKIRESELNRFLREKEGKK